MTIAAAPCYDGDLQAVNAASALGLARGAGADVVVCAIGPGIVGTASALGHGGVAAAEAANAAAALGGRPVLAPRISSATRASVIAACRTTLAPRCGSASGTCRSPGRPGSTPPGWFERVVEVDTAGWEAACGGLPLSHMGRGPEEDPWFFAAAFAAGRLARKLAS